MPDDDLEDYLRELRSCDAENAFHSLIEAGARILPRLAGEFDREADPEIRAALLEIVWQLRVPECLPILERALQDPAPRVWKEALNGLVTLASAEAIAVLEAALARADTRGPRAREYREWVVEALEQAQGKC